MQEKINQLQIILENKKLPVWVRNLTVVQMALKELKSNNFRSAIERLWVDMDKLFNVEEAKNLVEFVNKEKNKL